MWYDSLHCVHAYAVNCSQVCQQRTTSSDEEGHKMWLKTFKLLSGSCDYVKLLFQGLEWIFKLRENDSVKCRHFLATFQAYAKGQKCHSNTGWCVTTLLADLSLQDCFNTYRHMLYRDYKSSQAKCTWKTRAWQIYLITYCRTVS